MNTNAIVILEDEHVLLRPLQLHDFEGLLPVAVQYPLLLQYSPSQIHTPEFLRQYIEQAQQDRQNGHRYAFSIFDKTTNQYVGCTSLGSISPHDLRLEIGWTWLGRAFQRTPINRHCKFLLLSYAFETLGYQRVEFRTDERNTASRRAIEKIGGTFEGILRSHTVLCDGFRRSTVYYSILRQEWFDTIKPMFATAFGISAMPDTSSHS